MRFFYRKQQEPMGLGAMIVLGFSALISGAWMFILMFAYIYAFFDWLISFCR